jgi:hypothetical protein
MGILRPFVLKLSSSYRYPFNFLCRNEQNFRDPTTAWFEEASGLWLTGVGTGLSDGSAAVSIYTSTFNNDWKFSNFMWVRPGAGML